MPDDPYVKVYYRIIDDERFKHVYGDDRALATWLRLLIAADAMYPAPAPIPRWCRPAALRPLVDAGLVDVLPGDHYRVHGLAKERAKRSGQAAEAGRKRAEGAQRQGGRFTSGPPAAAGTAPPAGGGSTETSGHQLATQSRAEQLRAEQSNGVAGGDAGAHTAEARLALLVEELTGQQFGLRPGSTVWARLRDGVREFGVERMEQEYRTFAATEAVRDVAQLVLSVHNRLHPIRSGSGPRRETKGYQPDMGEIHAAFGTE